MPEGQAKSTRADRRRRESRKESRRGSRSHIEKERVRSAGSPKLNRGMAVPTSRDLAAAPTLNPRRELVIQNEELRRIRQELETARNKYADLYDSAPVGYFTVGANGLILEANLTGATLLDTPRRSLLGKSLERFIADQDQELFSLHRQQLVSTRKPQSCEIRLTSKNGHQFWAKIESNVVQGDDRKFARTRTVIRDVTERKRTENKIRRSQKELRRLHARLQKVQEEQSTRIAREIHDELGQDLTALKFDLAWLRKKLPANQAAAEKINAMLEQVGGTIQTVRRISTELRTPLLDDLGLAAAIESQGREFASRTGIEFELDFEPEEPELEPELATALFRILQEALTNVARHAHATRVWVSLKEKPGKLVFKVRDNGQGITPQQIGNSDSIGLIGIRERAVLQGGKAKITGVPGKGTTLTVSIALKPRRTQNSEQGFQN